MKNFERLSINSEKLLNNEELVTLKGGTEEEWIQHICRVMFKYEYEPVIIDVFIPKETTDDCEYVIQNSQVEIYYCYYCHSND